MSNDIQRRRRRIAGERKPGRSLETASRSEERVPQERELQPVAARSAGDAPAREDVSPASPAPARPGVGRLRRRLPARAEELGPGNPAAGPAAETDVEPHVETGEGERARRAVPVPVLGGLAAVVLLLVALVSWYGVPRLDAVRQADAVQAAQQAAPAAAERAATSILSYDYTALDTDRNSAMPYMTKQYGQKYAHTFDTLVKQNAARLKAKVVAKVLASGVSTAQPDRVNVLLYVNQTTTSTANGGQPQVAMNRVMFSMVKQGGSWLVDNITSY